MRVYQVRSRNMCAGIVVQDGRVARTAPIVKYMRKWQEEAMVNYCHMRGFTLIPIGRKGGREE